MLCSYFGESVPESTEEKKAFLFRNGIALWDVITACEIDGSSDASVKNAEIADLCEIFRTAKIEKILLNGSLAFRLFEKYYADTDTAYEKMPSTSPANPRYTEDVWRKALDDVFRVVDDTKHK